MTTSRAPEHVTVAIIGSGFGGQCAAINLTRRGITSYAILEQRDFVGGTWIQNTYPGAAVDVQSPLYSFSFEPYPWTEMYAKREELARYTNHIIDRYGLREHIFTNHRVEEMRWDEERAVWRIETSAGSLTATFVINATGPLSTPKIPSIPGKSSFQGDSFHTNGWAHDVDLGGKRVAIVGSGASAAQVIPEIAPEVGHLHVFQRSAHWVMPRHDHVFSERERARLKSRAHYSALRAWIYASLESRVIALKYARRALVKYAQQPALEHLHAQIEDPELRAKLTPDYTLGCKRVILSNTLYPALASANVTLRARDQAITQLTPTGAVLANGEELELDVIIWATGFEIAGGLVPYAVTGRDGKKLSDFWADYPRAYLGTSMPGFPNMFVVMGPNTGIGHTSAIFIIESQMRYIMSALDKARQHGWRSVEVSPDAERRYTNKLHEQMQGTVWQNGGCHSWYKDASGRVIAIFPGFSFTFHRMTRKFVRADHVVELPRSRVG